MKNILVATDFSKEAYCALHYASQLFESSNCKFYIANFIGDKVHASIYSDVNEKEFSKIPTLLQDSEIKITELNHQIIRDSGFSVDRFETISSKDKLIPGLKNLIQSLEIDLLVMGTKKHSSVLESFFGTHTIKVIENALLVPLLIVPRELEFKAPKNIAYATELIFDFNFNILNILKEVASLYNSKITVFHEGEELQISQRQWKNYNSFKKFFKDIPVELEFSSSHKEISKSISEFVKENDVDILSMEFYKHSAAGNLFREPVVAKIDQHLSFPFLVLPEKKLT